MARYWVSEPKQTANEPSTQLKWGCYVFVEHRSMALCQAYGCSSEEAHDQAHLIIAAMKAVEQQPAAAAAARHYIVRSPVHANVALHCSEGTALQLAYDDYFDACEKANKTPKSFDQWKAGLHE